MRLNCLHLSRTKQAGPSIVCLTKPLLWLGCGIILILAPLGNLIADELPPPVPANSEPLPDNPANPDSSQTSGNPQTPDNSQTSGNAQPPENTETPGNPQVPSTPLLPQQGSSPYAPVSPSSSNTQSTQLTAPSLYTTGVNDLSQVATNAALMQAFSQQATSGFLGEQGMGYSHGPIERIRLGPFDLKAALSLNVVSDDNLTAVGQSGGEKLSDTSLGITPAVLLEYGTHEGQKGYASLVYSPTITRFLEHTDEDTVNQNVAFNARYPFQKLSLDFSQTYAQVTGINQDLNARTTQTSSVTTVGGNYDINDKLSVASHFQELITSFSGGGGQGDKTSSINSSLAYHVSEKMTLGPNLNVGVDEPENASKQTFEQALLGMNYQATEKIALSAQGGAEFRQFNQDTVGDQTVQAGNTTNPIFSAGVAYTPFDSTSLSVNAFQNVQSSSADSLQTVVNTGVGFSANQRIIQRFNLGFTFSYSHADYSNTGGASTTALSQDNVVYRPSLSYSPTAWTSVAIYYQYLDNESNQMGSSYHDNQMGVAVSAQF
jgi:hypothetical protein